MSEISKNKLTVRKINPGFGITSTHSGIITPELATCIAVGGITDQKTLFMTHQPDFAHNKQLQILSNKFNLSKGKGQMVVFAADPGFVGRGYFTRIDQGDTGYSYAEALTILIQKLKGNFPGFTISHLPYGDPNKGPQSHAEIDLTTFTASTNSGSLRLLGNI